MFDIDGEGILAEEEYEPIALCNECHAALEKWLGIGAEDDLRREEARNGD